MLYIGKNTEIFGLFDDKFILYFIEGWEAFCLLIKDINRIKKIKHRIILG